MSEIFHFEYDGMHRLVYGDTPISERCLLDLDRKSFVEAALFYRWLEVVVAYDNTQDLSLVRGKHYTIDNSFVNCTFMHGILMNADKSQLYLDYGRSGMGGSLVIDRHRIVDVVPLDYISCKSPQFLSFNMFFRLQGEQWLAGNDPITVFWKRHENYIDSGKANGSAFLQSYHSLSFEEQVLKGGMKKTADTQVNIIKVLCYDDGGI